MLDMGAEQKGNFAIRTEIRPLIPGSNPFQEPKFKSPNTRELNHKAVLQERVSLFDGVSHPVVIADIARQLSGFVDIRKGFFVDDELVYQPFVYWGLKDTSTGERLRGYSDSTTGPDPIHIYRTVKILEALPLLEEDPNAFLQSDFVAASAAAKRVFYWFEQTPDSRRNHLSFRSKIAENIGRDQLREILNTVPPNLEEMIEAMRKIGMSMSTRTLQRELRAGILAPSEFYADLIGEDYSNIRGMMEGLEEAGWLENE